MIIFLPPAPPRSTPLPNPSISVSSPPPPTNSCNSFCAAHILLSVALHWSRVDLLSRTLKEHWLPSLREWAANNSSTERGTWAQSPISSYRATGKWELPGTLLQSSFKLVSFQDQILRFQDYTFKWLPSDVLLKFMFCVCFSCTCTDNF